MKSLLVIFAVVAVAVAFPEPELRERRGIISPVVGVAAPVLVAPKLVAPVAVAAPLVPRVPIVTKTVLASPGLVVGKGIY